VRWGRGLDGFSPAWRAEPLPRLESFQMNLKIGQHRSLEKKNLNSIFVDFVHSDKIINNMTSSGTELTV